MRDWVADLAREETRYRDGLARLPQDPDARQRQLVRVANAAGGAGLASLMAGRGAEACAWFLRAAGRYRESFAGAPAGSWGRLIGAVKMRLLAGDWEGAAADARWALAQGPAETDSPIGRYAACLAQLALGHDDRAAALAAGLREESEERFPRSVADTLAALATRDGALYRAGLARTLQSFETRTAYLEDLPVADTVLVLDILAEPRRLAARPESPLLPPLPLRHGDRELSERPPGRKRVRCRAEEDAQ